MTNIKFFKFVKKDVMIDDIEGFFEVHKQGTNGALVIKGFHPWSWSCHSGHDLGLISFGLGLVVLVLVLRI